MTFEYLSSDKNHPQALKTTAKHTTLGCQVRLEALMSMGEWKEGIAGISNLFSFQQEFNAQENFCKDDSSCAFKTAKGPHQGLLEIPRYQLIFSKINIQKRFRFMKYL
jgi:hypothetical protein